MPEEQAEGGQGTRPDGWGADVQPREDGPPVMVERLGPVLSLTLHRPERMNAVTLPLYQALTEAVERAREETELRVMVISGAGRAFSVGADLKAHGGEEPSPAERRRYVAAGQATNQALQRSPLPVVAAVNGHAVGAGLELALSADLLVVARDARLRFPESTLGTSVGGGVSYTLPRSVGMARARELLLLGRFFTPAEALGMGLVNRVVPAEKVLGEAMSLARELADRAPLSIRGLKDLLARALQEDSAALLAREGEVLLACMETADWREGIQAFHEKRKPRFIGA
jgi:enoyl-CoA hydratase